MARSPQLGAFACAVNFAALYYSSIANAEGTDKSPQHFQGDERERDTKLVWWWRTGEAENLILKGTPPPFLVAWCGIEAGVWHSIQEESFRNGLCREVTVTYEKTDQYGRLVGKILLDGRDINLEQVRTGMAWHYKEYQREQTPNDRELYARAEDEARTGRRGLWTDANPTPPSQFRKDRRSESDLELPLRECVVA